MNYTFEKLRDIIECFDPCMDNYLYVYDIIQIYTLYRKGQRKDLHFHLIVLQMQWKNTANLYIQRIMMR